MSFLAHHTPTRTTLRSSELGFVDRSRLLGEMWRSVSPGERQELLRTHALQRSAYESEVQRLTLQSAAAGVVATRDGSASGGGGDGGGDTDGNGGGGGGGNAASSNGSSSADTFAGRVALLARPKRPTSAYLFFTMEHRPLIRESRPELGFSDVARELGERWRALTHAQRMPYSIMYKQDKLRFETEERAWKVNLCLP
jgi:hypothetical protein